MNTKSALAGVFLLLAGAGPASAQFTTREGYAADGRYQASVEITPYLWLPAVNGTVGLRRAADFDVSVSRPRITVSELRETLTAAALGDALVRYGPYSIELNAFYVSAKQTKILPAFGTVPQASLTSSGSVVRVAPGFGYQLIPNEAGERVAFDLRAGFSYLDVSAKSAFAESRFGGVSGSFSEVQPWLGVRADYLFSPSWRARLQAAVMGLGTNGGSWGWNANFALSYLVTKWFDVSLGYAGIGTSRPSGDGPNDRSRAFDLRAHGPVLAMGFRF